jgi:light-regulated signal transduction histidine kinase (bacteriophytochrome)
MANEELNRQELNRIVSRLNHDLRQPLQTLSILIDVLRRRTEDAESLKLIERQEIAMHTILQLLDDIDKVLAKR